VETPAELEAGALSGSTRCFTIPAGTLGYGQAYFVDVIFAKVIEGKPLYSGRRNGMASVHTTSFYLHTIASPTAGATAAVRRAESFCPCAQE
jgi:hypothetical protein